MNSDDIQWKSSNCCCYLELWVELLLFSERKQLIWIWGTYFWRNQDVVLNGKSPGQNLSTNVDNAIFRKRLGQTRKSTEVGKSDDMIQWTMYCVWRCEREENRIVRCCLQHFIAHSIQCHGEYNYKIIFSFNCRHHFIQKSYYFHLIYRRSVYNVHPNYIFSYFHSSPINKRFVLYFFGYVMRLNVRYRLCFD